METDRQIDRQTDRQDNFMIKDCGCQVSCSLPVNGPLCYFWTGDVRIEKKRKIETDRKVDRKIYCHR
jgi:hypothetical protein